MNIFNKQFSEITFQDVEGLVSKKIRESEVLDYKEKFEAEAATKLISALANTYGGFIVYGVKCNKDTNEPEEIVSIEDRKLDDTIDSICYDNIIPPVSCDSKYLYDEKRTILVFVIKVPESDLTPHAVENNTTVYVKVRGQKRPFQKADLDRQEWLKQRRLRSVDLREKLISKARERRKEIFAAEKEDYATELYLAPRFPRSSLLNLESLVPFLRNNSQRFGVPINDYHLNLNTYFTVNYGVSWHQTTDNCKFYSEFNVYGLYYNFCAMPKRKNTEGEAIVIDFANLATSFIQQTFLAIELLEKLEFRGSIVVGYNIINLKHSMPIYELEHGRKIWQLSMGNCKFDNSVEHTSVVESTGVRDSIKEVLCDFFKQLIHVYTIYDLDPKHMGKQIYEITYGRLIKGGI